MSQYCPSTDCGTVRRVGHIQDAKCCFLHDLTYVRVVRVGEPTGYNRLTCGSGAPFSIEPLASRCEEGEGKDPAIPIIIRVTMAGELGALLE